MKALQLSSLALILLGFFSSCKKDTDAGLTDAGRLSATVQSDGVADKKPLLTPYQQPGPVAKGNSVTITYTATNKETGAPVQCGRVKIYQLKNGSWTEVASGNAPTVSVSILAETADDCAYKFRAGFDPGGTVQCRGAYTGVDYLLQPDFCADVVEPCVQVFTIDGAAEAIDLNNGLFEFTIRYTLTSPVDVNGVKFQGGATAGGNSGHAITSIGDFAYVNINNNNTVIKWEGDLKACTPKVLTFKYTRNFNCGMTGALVTGDWSASAGGQLLGAIAKLPYSCQQ